MSLIVASSAQGEFNYGEEGANIGSGIQRPFSFRNHLSNTITIPPNSEVAVTSAQIYRSDIVTITPQTRAYAFHGLRDNDKGLASGGSDPIPIRFTPGTYSTRQAQIEIGRAMSEAFGQHPDLRRSGPSSFPPVGVGPANVNDSPVPSPLSGYNFIVQQTPRLLQGDIVAAFASGADRSLSVDNVGNNWLAENPNPSLGFAISSVAAGSGAEFKLTRNIENRNIAFPAEDNMAVAILTDAPIPQNGVKGWTLAEDAESVYSVRGAFCVDLSEISGTGDWSIGLSRPGVVRGERDPITGAEEMFPAALGIPEDFDAYGNQFYDYEVRFSKADSVIRLFHSVIDTNDDYKMREITYWGADGGASTMIEEQVTEADMIFNKLGDPGPYDELNFNVWGEGIQIYLRDSSGTNPGVPIMDTLVDSTNTLLPAAVDNSVWTALGLSRAAKPTNQNTWALYPKISLAAEDDAVAIVQYNANCEYTTASGRARYSFDFPSIPQASARSWFEGGLYGSGVGSSWWGRVMKGIDPLYVESAREIDGRGNVRLDDPLSLLPRVCMDTALNIAVGGTTGDCLSKRYGYGLIIQPTDKTSAGGYDRTLPLVFPNEAQYTRPLLGFGKGSDECDVSGQILSPVNLDGSGTSTTNIGVGIMSATDGTNPTAIGGTSLSLGYGLWVFQSSSPPVAVNSTAFVRIPSLTHQSYNFCKSLPSKILWQIPKFTPDGRSSGSMYFTNPSPIYLDLQNPNPLTLQQLDVDIVDKNERFCRELGGATTITLHFREKKGHHSC